jgi:hypothetical protein
VSAGPVPTSDSPDRRPCLMDSRLSQALFWIWVLEIAVSGFNYAVLMNRIYQPRFGELKAHQIGMTTRMVYILVFAYFLDDFARLTTPAGFLLAGLCWLMLILAFEWVGSFILRRPVKEILIGWHIEKGWMWPYVLLTYLLSPLVVGLILRPAA